EEVLRILIDAAKPRLVRDGLDAFDLRDAGLVADWQRLNEADLVHHHQSIGPGHVDAHRERRADDRQHAIEDECDENRADGEDRPRLAAEQIAPDEMGEFHACPAWAPASTKAPFSRCSVRVARSAACGSCVTMTMVLPCSLLSVCSSVR